MQPKKEEKNLFQNLNLLEGNDSPAKNTMLINLHSEDDEPEIKGSDLINNMNSSPQLWNAKEDNYKPPSFEEKQQMLIDKIMN